MPQTHCSRCCRLTRCTYRSVDDLQQIGDLELYIDQSGAINIFLSHWYFKSQNCLREVQSTVDKAKPFMLTHEVEVPKGGGPLEEIKVELTDQRLSAAVFSEGRRITIWYRIAAFQLISLKQLAEFTLLQTPEYKDHNALGIYVPGELLCETLVFTKPVVVYASPHNPGARALAAKLEQVYSGITATEKLLALSTHSDDATAESNSGDFPATHFLLYLNFDTYLEDAGRSLAEELRRARAAKLPLVMTHENAKEHGGCEFGRFFSTTPQDLIDDGLYHALAFACYPGDHRAASMALLAKALGAIQQGHQPLTEISKSARQRAGELLKSTRQMRLRFSRVRNVQVVTGTQLAV